MLQRFGVEWKEVLRRLWVQRELRRWPCSWSWSHRWGKKDSIWGAGQRAGDEEVWAEWGGWCPPRGGGNGLPQDAGAWESGEGMVRWMEAPGRVLEPWWGEKATHRMEEAVVATGAWLVTHRGRIKKHGAGFSRWRKRAVHAERKPERRLWCWSALELPLWTSSSRQTDRDRNGRA